MESGRCNAISLPGAAIRRRTNQAARAAPSAEPNTISRVLCDMLLSSLAGHIVGANGFVRSTMVEVMS